MIDPAFAPDYQVSPVRRFVLVYSNGIAQYRVFENKTIEENIMK